MNSKRLVGVKRILVFLLFFLLVLPLNKVSFAESSSEGEKLTKENASLSSGEHSEKGTQENPYLISNVDQLKNINNNLSAYYVLTNDIDLKGVTWEPLDKFEGVLEGRGYTISNFFVSDNRGVSYRGLFSRSKDATFKNINIESANVNGRDYVGALVGYGYHTTILNVNIKNVNIVAERYGGALIGSIIGDVERCSSNANVNSNNYAGGLIGSLNGNVNECYAQGLVQGNRETGGLIGKIDRNKSIVKNSYAICDVQGDSIEGGLVGYIYGYSNSEGDRAKVVNCFSASKNVPLFGYITSTDLESSYYDGLASQYEPQNDNDISELTINMLKKDTYKNWDFENIWDIDEGKRYPFLRNIEESKSETEVSLKNCIKKGNGTMENPYQIATKEDLNCIRYDVNSNYELLNDIDMKGSQWIPIGKMGGFEGVFDGKDHTISNFNISNSSTSNKGLFARTRRATIKNLKLDDIHVDGNEGVGALIGYGYSTNVENIHIGSNGLINGGNERVGGIAGELDVKCNITKCSSKIEVRGEYYIGGLVGQFEGIASECYSTSKVAGKREVGGLIGRIEASKTTIKDCYTIGEVHASTYPAGLIGYVSGASTSKEGRAKIINCYSATKNAPLFGYVTSTDITSTFYDAVAANYEPKNDNDRAVLTTNMKKQSNFVDWDFDRIWNIEEGGSYPYLRNIEETDKVRSGLPTDEIAGGDGSVKNPYLISSKKHLDNVRFDLNSSYKLINDIDLKNEEWQPIGRMNSFSGIFDGDGFVIKNLYIPNATSSDKGLFGRATHATIKNLYLDNVDVTGYESVGALLGYGHYVDLENVNITENGQIVGKHYWTGGLVGKLVGNIRQCSSKIRVEGDHYVGGIVGEIDGTISESYAISSVNGKRETGGLIGHINRAKSVVENCFVKSDVTGSSITGSFIGLVYGKGHDEDSAKIINCYCISNENIPFYGYCTQTEIVSSYFDSTLSGCTSPSEMAKSTEQLKDQSTYVGWDFENKWNMNAGEYPILKLIPIPKNFKSEKITAYSIELTWNSVDGVSDYEIEVDGKVFDVIGKTRYEHLGLEPSQKHEYKIRAKGGEWSRKVEVWTATIQPKNLKAKVLTNKITISWDAVVGATGYELELQGKVISIGNHTEYVVNDILPNVQYAFRIRAKNAGGVSQWSGMMTATSISEKPKGLSSIDEDTSIILNWNPVAGASSYEIEIDSKSIVTCDKCNYEYKGLEQATVHTFRVRAISDEGKSEWSDIYKTKTKPEVPQNIIAISGPFSVELSWKESQGSTSYELEIDGKIVEISENSYIHKDILPNTEHTYRVRGKNAEVVSSWSELISIKTLIADEVHLIYSATSDKIILEWNSIVGAEKYEIEADGNCISTGLNTRFDHYELVPNTEHRYRVRVYNEEGAGQWSDTLVVSTKIDVPQNISIVPGNDQIIIEWDGVIGATSYEIMIDSKIIDIGLVNSYVHENLEPNSFHIYRIRAICEKFKGDWSNGITASTKLGVPLKLRYKPYYDAIEVRWDSVVGATSYDIEFSSEDAVNSNSCSYLFDELEPNEKYRCRVRAKNSNMVGEWSEYISCMTMSGIPENLQTEATTTQITLTWDKCKKVLGYEVEVDGVVVKDIKKEKFVHENLKPNTWHTYRVRSVNEMGISDWSEEIDQNTNPQILVRPGRDSQFNFVIVVPPNDENTRIVTVSYDPSELEVIDLCAATPELNTQKGKIKGTRIKVNSIAKGEVEFEIDSRKKAIVNIIKFSSKTNDYSKIEYGIQ